MRMGIARMRRIAGLVALLAAGTGPVQAAEPLDEYQIKAAFLYRFAQFVAWPDVAFESQLVRRQIRCRPHGPGQCEHKRRDHEQRNESVEHVGRIRRGAGNSQGTVWP